MKPVVLLVKAPPPPPPHRVGAVTASSHSTFGRMLLDDDARSKSTGSGRSEMSSSI